MARTIHYLSRYYGHKMYLKEGQERKYGKRVHVKQELKRITKERSN